MNLQTHIQRNLWLAVQSTYEAGNFAGAILDAMHYVSNVLRERTGADGDGQTLVGQALGGDSPRLRINKLQSETERNEQRGMESLLRGMYQAIRNPRSHELIQDSQETADAIIYFINYLLGIIERSEEPFMPARFIARVFDPDFFNSQQYAELLVEEIPTHKRFDMLIAIFREKLNGDIYHLKLIINALLSKLTEDQVKQYLAIVSEELTTVTEEKEFRYNIYLVPPVLWEQVSEVAKLRAENRIIKEIKDGLSHGDTCSRGALATWAREHLKYFRLKFHVASEFLKKLQSDSWQNRQYVVVWFLSYLPEVMLSPQSMKECVQAISAAIREGDEAIRDSLVKKIDSLPYEWQNEFATSLQDMTDEDSPATYIWSGTPLLARSPSTVTNPEDEIPF